MKRIILAVMMISLFNLNTFSQSKKEKKIAFVDITVVMAKYKKNVDAGKQFNKEVEKFEEDIEKKQRRIKQAKEDVKEAEGEEGRMRAQLRYIKLKKEFKFFQELNKEKMSMQFRIHQIRVIKDIKKAIHDYGKVNGYFLILQTHPPMPKNEEMRSLVMQVNVADVMYYDANYDISSDIYNKLNTSYANRLREEAKLKKENGGKD